MSLIFLTSCPDLSVVVTEGFVFVDNSESNNKLILGDDDNTG